MMYCISLKIICMVVLHIGSVVPFLMVSQAQVRYHRSNTEVRFADQRQGSPFEDAMDPFRDDGGTSNSFLPEDHPVGMLYQRKQQLWIDLRETSLFPHEANTFLMDQLFSSSPAINGALKKIMEDPITSARPLFDGALVSESMLQYIIEKRSPGAQNAPYFLLYNPTDGNQLLIDESVSQKTYVIGRTVTCDRTNRLDPLLALETVVEKQNWLLVDYKDRGATEVNQILDVLQLLSSPNTAALSLDDSEIKEEALTDSKSALKGGIAVACSDVNSFMALDSKVAEIRNLASMRETSTTASGLIIPSTGEHQASANSAPSVPTMALILPLDLTLWKTANDVRNIIDR